MTQQGLLTIIIGALCVILPISVTWILAVKKTPRHAFACPNCDADVPATAARCPNCGAAMPDQDVTV